jgi:FAD:protein FMN transferase
VTAFTSMGCTVELSGDANVEAIRLLFAERDRRFSRFLASSELCRVNASPAGLILLSEEFASMVSLALDAARSTGGLVTPTVGGAVVAAGYDRDFGILPRDGVAVGPARVPPLSALSLRGRMLLRSEPVELDLNGVVKGRTVDDALKLAGSGWVAAGGDVATTAPVVVGLPEGGTVTLDAGGLATSSVAKRTWLAGGERQHHLIDPATGAPARTPWRDVTVAAGSCLAADVAAKAALLLGHAGPSWLDRRDLAGRFVAHDGRVLVNEHWQQAVPSAPLAA